MVFGATVSGRPAQLAGVERMVGLFLNAIPVRVRVRPGDTVAELLRKLQDDQAALLDHHYLGLGEIQEIAGIDALFDSLVVFESFPVDREGLAQAASGSAAVTGMDAANGTHYPLTVQIVADSQLRVSVKYLRDVFGEDTANAMAQRFSMLLARFTASPKARIAEIDVLLAEERATLAAVNATDAPELLDEATLLSLFDAQVKRTPDATALIDGETVYTYAEFDDRVRALAAGLRAEGARPETLVAVAMRRGIDLVTAIYAVLRTGAAYVPVDPDHPAERTERVLAAAAPICVLASGGFTTTSGIPVIEIDALSGEVADLEMPKADNLAYVIHTSGSTGTPKGVMLTHRQLVNQFRWAQRTYPHGPGDVVLHKTPVTFDIATWELLWPLHTGATVVIAAPDGHRDPAYLAEVIAERAVTTVHFVPSMLDAFLTDRDSGEFPSLRWVFAAGEALSSSTARRFAQVVPEATLVNWYGPAEATVVTAAQVEAGPAVGIPIGTPVANTRVHVLDRQLRPVPPGTAGELYLEGVQLARGYLGAPTLTAERFVARPGGGRLYRTGDVVRLTSDESLEYLGRSDFQVKLRGQRIELGEVEAVLRDHHSVRHAAVAPCTARRATDWSATSCPRRRRSRKLARRLAPRAIRSKAAPPLSVSISPRCSPTPGRRCRRTWFRPAWCCCLPCRSTPAASSTAKPCPSAFTTRASPHPRPRRCSVRSPRSTRRCSARARSVSTTTSSNSVATPWSPPRRSADCAPGSAPRCGCSGSSPTPRSPRWPSGSTPPSPPAANTISPPTSNPTTPSVSCWPSATGCRTAPRRAARCSVSTRCTGCPGAMPVWRSNIPARLADLLLCPESPALSEAGYLPGTLAEMARRYAAEIRTEQPHGPYRPWAGRWPAARPRRRDRTPGGGGAVSLLAMLHPHPDIDVPDFHTAARDALAELGVDISAALPAAGVREPSQDALAALHAIIPANMGRCPPPNGCAGLSQRGALGRIDRRAPAPGFRGRSNTSARSDTRRQRRIGPRMSTARCVTAVAVVHDQMTRCRRWPRSGDGRRSCSTPVTVRRGRGDIRPGRDAIERCR